MSGLEPPQPRPSTSSLTILPPPQCIQRDDSADTKQALMKVSPKRNFFRSRRKTKDAKQGKDRAVCSQTEDGSNWPNMNVTEGTPFVKLGKVPVYGPELEEDYSKDVYKWAILYENQRGVVMFSTAYYSSLSLLPIDPPPFTIPSVEKISRRHQPTVSLSSYPLPDGTWQWVSKTWMVDMRGDGQTQYDGFEYNWFFRRKHWRDQVGHLSAGGWVRRRRWVRLMMRPARPKGVSGLQNEGDRLDNTFRHDGTGATRPPSVIPSLNEEDDEDKERRIWTGDPEQDWERCRQELRRAPHDGRRLELWKEWLGLMTENIILQPEPAPFKGKSRDLLETQPLTMKTLEASKSSQIAMAKAPTEYLRPVLGSHAEEVLRIFVYPNSRAAFMELLTRSDMLKVVEAGMGVSNTSQLVDFWSSARTLNRSSG